MTWAIYSNNSLSDMEECIFTAKLNLNLLWTMIFAWFEPKTLKNKQETQWEVPRAQENW
jgi:hypothetical protein